MTRSTSRAATLGLLVVLLGGGIAMGIALDRLWLRPEAGRRRAGKRRTIERLVQRLRKRLELRGDQAEVVGKALREGRVKIRALRGEVRPKIAAVRAGIRERIRAVLSAQQRTRYDKMVQRFDARRKARRRKRNSK